MSDQNSVPSQEPAETTATPTPTPSTSPDDALRNIASEFSVEEQVKSFTATPSPVTVHQPQQFYAPDPVTDPEGHKRYMTEQFNAGTQLRSTLDTVLNEVNNFKQTFQQQKVNADVDRAVQVVNAKVKGDPELVEAMLNIEYTKNPTFKKIFDNRDRNPFAYEKALGIIADKFVPKFQIRQDPQIAENVRAAQSSQRTMATTQTNSSMDAVANMNEMEFERWKQNLMRG